MLAKRIIPCLDVHKGRVVKGVNFVNLRDAGDPVEIASVYDKAGADELVFLDITASSDARSIMLDVVRRTAEQVFIPFTVGGGIRTVDDFRDILKEGADKISVNSAALKRPELISEAAGRDIFESMMDEKLMDEASKTNSFGLANQMYKQLSRQMNAKYIVDSEGDTNKIDEKK